MKIQILSAFLLLGAVNVFADPATAHQAATLEAKIHRTFPKGTYVGTTGPRNQGCTVIVKDPIRALYSVSIQMDSDSNRPERWSNYEFDYSADTYDTTDNESLIQITWHSSDENNRHVNAAITLLLDGAEVGSVEVQNGAQVMDCHGLKAI